MTSSFFKNSNKKSINAVGNILLNRRNYWLVEISQYYGQRKDLNVVEEWKIEKGCIKLE